MKITQKIKNIFLCIFSAVAAVVATVAIAVTNFHRKRDVAAFKKAAKTAENAKQNEINRIKNTDANTLVSDSTSTADISATKQRLANDAVNRIEDELRKRNIH